MLSIGVHFAVQGDALSIVPQRTAHNVGEFILLMRLLSAVDRIWSGWSERGDEVTVAIPYNNQRSAVEYSSCVCRLEFLLRISYEC